MDILQTPDASEFRTYFAVQILPNEDPHQTAGAVCQAGQLAKTLFRRLEVMDTIIVANRPFLRCRSDVANPLPLLGLLFMQKRAYVAALANGQYSVKLPDGRSAIVPGTIMHLIPRSGHPTVYRGPKIKLWERAFGLPPQDVSEPIPA
jgi:hypothetical protein